jgi:hypothetical protein
MSSRANSSLYYPIGITVGSTAAEAADDAIAAVDN